MCTWLWDDMPLNSPKRTPYWNTTSGFDFDHITAVDNRHVILLQSPKFYPNRTTLGRKKMTSCRFSRWRISAILDFRDPIMGSLKSPGTTSYRSSIDTIALNCLVFEKIAFLYFDDRQTNKQTNKQMDSSDALSSSGYRERRLNKKLSYHKEAARCSLSLKILPSFNFQFYTVEYGECVSSY